MLPYDPAIPLLGVYPENTIMQKDTGIPVFFAALFAIAKRFRKQPKSPLTDDWIKLRDIYTVEYYSTIKKNELALFPATWMDLDKSEVSQTKTNTIQCYMWNPKYDTD